MIVRLVTAALLVGGMWARVCSAGTGELLKSGRVPDYSYAGYHDGEKNVPGVGVVANVRDFGAKGDGVTDDVGAFRAAVAAAGEKGGGAVLVPAGRYVLGDVVTIDRPGVVLRGEGRGKTVLVVPRSLEQIHPKGFSEGEKLAYAFGGGFVTVKGEIKGEKLADVAAGAKRGDRVIELSNVAGVKKGDVIRLIMGNQKSLGRYLHGGLFDAGEATYVHKNFVDFTARVVGVEGRRVTIDRPLRTDVRGEWGPAVWSFRPTVYEAGVEGMTFQFPGVPKKKHLQEEGFNAIQMTDVVEGWVKDVEVIDGDIGVKLDGCRGCTVSGVVVRAVKRKEPSGHHALWASGHSQDCLFKDFDIETRFVHDLSVEGFANGCVFEKGRGKALNLDHHRNGPYGNLFTELRTGDVSRLWDSSGRGDRGPHSAGWETVWGIQWERGKLPPVPDWPLLNVVGVRGYETRRPSDNTAWVEGMGAEKVEPPNLYEAQLRARVKK